MFYTSQVRLRGKDYAKEKIVILGAGPAGLAVGAALRRAGMDDFVILEKESTAGGLCRSVDFDGGPLDVGGGHILDVRNRSVVDFVFSYLPESEWNLFNRNTKIRIGANEVGYPLESNIWQFPEAEQIAYLESIARAGCIHGIPMPEKFTDWIYWKLGERIAETYMLPYNQKIFSCDLNDLGTYWLYKLPDVSFREVLVSCLRHQPFGTLPGHAQFYYPKKYGYGEVFLRIAKDLSENIRYNTPVRELDWQNRIVNREFQAESYIINTVPWGEFAASLPPQVAEKVAKLRYTSVDIDYFSGGEETTDAHWTYCADPELSYHRLLHRNNFAEGTRGYWRETNSSRAAEPGEYHFRNQYAYPLNTLDKPAEIAAVLDWAKSCGIIGLGRWGEWEHMNSDVAMDKGLKLGASLAK